MRRLAVVRTCALLVWMALPATQAVAQNDPHAGHQMPQPAGQTHPEHQPDADDLDDLPAFIPELSDEDRAAAFPDLEGHAVHDRAVNYYVLFDHFEWQSGPAPTINLDTRGWIGKDRNRFWFRTEGDRYGGRIGNIQTHLLYGRQISRWWDLVAGVRQDFHSGTVKTSAAIGVQGVAPYFFDIEATAYVGPGRSHARFEVEYELLFTNRLILQPQFEAEVYAQSDPALAIGTGLSTTDYGFRLRYEIRREFAPYAGVTWSNKWGQTARFAESAGESTGGGRFVGGLRMWF